MSALLGECRKGGKPSVLYFYRDIWKSNLKSFKVPTSFVGYDLIYSLISRVSSRVFVGAPTCYHKAWIEAVNAFPMDVEKTKFALLLFPVAMRSWIIKLLPQKWRLIRNHRNVQNLLFPASKLNKSKEDYTVLNLLLQTSKDIDPETLASRMILLTAAAVSISTAHVGFEKSQPY